MAKALRSSIKGSLKSSINRGLLAVVLWTPSELTGLQLWLDADDATTITESSGSVSQWDDKSGNGNHAVQSTASAQPTYGTRFVNSKNTLDFAIGDFLEPGFAPAINRTIAVVSAYDISSGLKVSVGARQDTNQRSYIGIDSSNTRFAAGDVSNTNGNATTTNTPIVQVGYHNSSFELVHYLNGTKDIDTTFGGTIGSGQNYYIGGLNDRGVLTQAAQFDGRISEIVILDSDIDDSNRQKLEGYLAHKWGTTSSLPANHPYKGSAPTV